MQPTPLGKMAAPSPRFCNYLCKQCVTHEPNSRNCSWEIDRLVFRLIGCPLVCILCATRNTHWRGFFYFSTTFRYFFEGLDPLRDALVAQCRYQRPTYRAGRKYDQSVSASSTDMHRAYALWGAIDVQGSLYTCSFVIFHRFGMFILKGDDHLLID